MDPARFGGRRTTTWSARVGVAAMAAIAAAGYAVAQPGWSTVAAILEERCTVCHAGDEAPLGVRLTDHAAVLAGGVDGAVVVPGDPEASELVRRVRGESLPRMPLTGPPFLNDAQIATIEAWVAAGAAGPDVASDGPSDGAPGGGGVLTPATAGVTVGVGGGAPAAAEAPDAPSEAGGAAHPFAVVEAILQARCVVCHAAEGALGGPPAGLMLISHDTTLAGGERVVVVPGNPLASELYRRVTGMARPRMPLDGPPYLDEAAIATIAAWIRDGAPGPDGAPRGVPAGGEVRLHGTLSGEWELDGLPLVVTDGTRFDDDPAVGAYVEVRGSVRADGAVEAERIRAR